MTETAWDTPAEPSARPAPPSGQADQADQPGQPGQPGQPDQPGQGYPGPGAAPTAWGQPSAGQAPPRPRKRGGLFWSLLLVPVALIAGVAVLIAGWVIDQNGRTTSFNQAHAAFERGDCPAALADYAKADKGSVPWGSTVEPDFADGPERDECGQLKDLAASWDAGDLAAAADGYEKFRSDHADSPSLISLYQLVKKSDQAPALLGSLPAKSACTTLKSIGNTRFSLETDFDSSTASVKYTYPKGTPDAAVDPANLVPCGTTFEKAGDTETAYELYSLALIYAHGKLKNQATSGTARTNVQLMKKAHAGKLPAPQKVSGTGSGPAVVVIQNDSTHKLKLTISGPEPVLTTIGACTSCRTYTDANGPSSCPTAGPNNPFRVPAGTYSVGVEKDFVAGDNQDVTPFVGSWVLKKGSRYETCFYIVTGPK